MAAPPTPVTCGSVITAPGQYVLASDCMGPFGIVIAASDVHLKLNGHTMTGSPPFMGPGIEAANAFNVSHLHIEGPGTITMFRRGIIFLRVSDSHVEKVTCLNNLGIGLDLADGTTNTHANNNISSMNSVAGVRGAVNSSDNHLDNNQAINNPEGIVLQGGATNYHVNGNIALGNGVDLEDGNANCDDNKWNGNRFNTADQPSCIH